MANYKANEQIIRRLTDEDKKVLLSIYVHRCLDESLLYKHFYSVVDVRRAYAAHQIQEMIGYRLLNEIDYGREFPALFLTTAGVETVKYLFYDKISSLYKAKGEMAHLPNASDLSITTRNINHQMHLNGFALDFEAYAAGKVYYTYYDEKFMPPASEFMMPDGMIELPNCYLFLEMDMGTENTQRLAQKWSSYRSFLNSPGFFYQEKPIVVLFIIEGMKNINVRRDNIVASLLSHIADRINGQFEVYIDGAEVLHEILKSQLLAWDTEWSAEMSAVYRNLRHNHGFAISTPGFLSQLDAPFGTYIRKLNEQKKILVINGRPQEFLFDVWLDGRLSILRTILHFGRLSGQVKSIASRLIPYLVVLPSEKWASTALQVMGCPQPSSVFFTTPARIAACNWAEALFSLDQLGNLVHYADASLVKPVHERRLAKT